jgi:CBS domain-containing protein
MMQRNVAAVRPNETLEDVARLLRDRSCGCVIVVDDERKPLGVVTDRDVCLAALRSGEPIDAIRASAAMSSRLITCRIHETIDSAERSMALHQVRRLPVVDSERRLVGILALDDLALEACSEEDWLAPPVSCAAVGRTLGQIARHKLLDLEEAT